MFESMIESTDPSVRKSRSRWAFPVSVTVHAVVVTTIVGVSLLAAEVVRDPQVILDLVIAAAPPPPPPPPPPPAGSNEPQAQEEIQEPEQIIPEPETIVQPEIVPEVIETATPPDEETGGGVAGGVEGGVEGGVIGGVLGGVEGGVVGGVVGGTGTEPLIAGSGGVTMPELIESSKIKPEFPEMARLARSNGRVILQAIIRRDGTVADAEVLQCKPPSLGFAEAAIEAVLQWRYKPALQGTTAVDVYMTVVVDFTLQ
jgi:protein TonB